MRIKNLADSRVRSIICFLNTENVRHPFQHFKRKVLKDHAYTWLTTGRYTVDLAPNEYHIFLKDLLLVFSTLTLHSERSFNPTAFFELF